MKALEISNLNKSYKNGPKVLKNVNLFIEEGDFFSLLGVNGAGKTTIIGILTDLVVKNSGEVKIYGKDLDKQKEEAKKHIGVVPQEFNLDFFQTVNEILITQSGYYGIERKDAEKRADELLSALGLKDKKHTKAMQLSGGMKRRVMIARALMHKPKLLILDEPTAGVDINLRKSTWEYMKKLNKEGMTILLTTHYLEEVEELCNRIAVMREGEVIANCTKKELFSMVKEFAYEIEISGGKIKENMVPSIYDPVIIAENKIKVNLGENDNLDEVINAIHKENLQIKSIIKKTNEIEELFIKLT